MTPPGRLEIARWETGRHCEALANALADWAAMPPGSWHEVEADPARVRLLDQILYRFTKLQDAVGERLVPATLAWLAEPSEDWPMRDRLDRLERLGYVDSTAWLEWRDVRNRLAHEYPDRPDLRWATVNAALGAARDLLLCARHWLSRLPPATTYD